MAVNISYHGPVAVFDLDDTLIGEREWCRGGFELLERHTGISGLAARMSRQLNLREPYMPLLDQCLPEASRAEIEALKDMYGCHDEPRIAPRPGVRTTLDALSSAGVAMALVTDGRGATQRAKLRCAGLERYFSPHLIYISGEQGCDKSMPDSFSDIVRQLPEAKRFIYIGDNPEKDVLMPSLLGWETVILAYNHDNVHPERDFNADSVSPTYKNICFVDILKIIGS